ncbi:phosphomevalonate kinase [Fructilactobacillus vespulae]|uniref:phosphomevalonate kinase n=1 Tax=Fructilactobacillus vespulae TaxID=1249630 RepID=UPI0039B69F72
MIKVKAPGKLYLAGEYAVVETGNPSIIAAVNRFVTVTVKETVDYGTISSQQFQKTLLRWQRVNSEMVLDNRDNPFQYIVSAIQVAESYAKSLNIEMKTYDIEVDSELDSGDGKKYGLGSSAAVTVATIKAICKLYKLNLSKIELFKLAAISHFEVQGNGSLGDIASSVFGGLISYSSFDRAWLSEFRKKVSLDHLIKLEWPYLEIIPLKIPSVLQFLVGWSGAPASTSHLIDKVELTKGSNQQQYQKFVHDSDKRVHEITNGFNQNNVDLIMDSIKHNRDLLLGLGKLANVAIETPKLTKLIEIADEFGGAAKTSGAGGGDCGIVLIRNTSEVQQVINKWRDNDIELLDIKIYNYPEE